MNACSHHPCPTHGSLANNQLCSVDVFGKGTYTTEGITKLCEGLKGSTVTSLKCAAAPRKRLLLCQRPLTHASHATRCHATPPDAVRRRPTPPDTVRRRSFASSAPPWCRPTPSDAAILGAATPLSLSPVGG